MSRPRRMHAPLLGVRRIDVPHAHRRFPVFEVVVADHDRNWRAEGFAASNAASDFGLIVLDLHPPAAPVAVLPASHIAIDPLAIEPNASRHPGDDDRKLWPMRLAGGNKREARHAAKSSAVIASVAPPARRLDRQRLAAAFALPPSRRRSSRRAAGATNR